MIARPDGRYIDGRKRTLLALAVLAALIVLRDPRFVSEPRLWAEEGKVYLGYALDHGWWDSLIKPHLGYFSLTSNVAGLVAAKAVPLHLAALITMAISFAVQFATAALVLTGGNRFAAAWSQRLVLAVGLIVFAPMETWLNSINLQFWFAAGTLYLLGQERIGRAGIAYLGAALLTGVPSLFFMPFFFLRAGLERSRGLILLCGFALAALAVQVYALVVCDDCAAGTRFGTMLLGNLGQALLDTFVAPFFKLPFGGPLAIIADLVLVLGFAGVAIALSLREPRTFVWAVLPALIYGALCIFASLGMNGGQRYALPLVIAFFIALLRIGVTLPARWRLAPALGLMVLHLPAFFATQDHYDASWPSWRTEAARACLGGNRVLRLFPQRADNHWELVLPESYCSVRARLAE